jgi:hypothetical protein
MKRYEDIGQIGLMEDVTGDYVRFEDVAQLERDYEATRAINVRLQQEVDDNKRNLAFWKAEAIDATQLLKKAIRSFPNDDGWLHAAQSFCADPGSAQQAPVCTFPACGHRDVTECAAEPSLIHEHNWSPPHDCGDPRCEAHGRVICLVGDSRCVLPKAEG